MKAKKARKHKDGMLAQKPSRGLERDNKGRAIPMSKRLAEDRAKARAAAGPKAKKAVRKKSVK